MKQLHVAENVAFPIEMMTLATAILANRGAGKTYLASVLSEELLSSGQQVIILDPVGVMWGLKSGYSIAIFGGDHADVPLRPDSGHAIAAAVVEHGFSAIFDLSEMDNQQALGFAAAFLSELYRKNKQSCYVVIDEADIFAPQSSTKGNGPNALRAMQFLVRRGRARGLGCALITQRPQAIAKDVLTQCEVLVALRVSHPRDIDAIKEWVNTQASAAESKEVVQSLPSLPTGEAWFWAPSLKLFQRAKVRMRKTFDSSATPKPGQVRVQPKHLESVDIAKLGQQIAATVEDQKANDPAALKARIRELERKLSAAPSDDEWHKRLEQVSSAAQESVQHVETLTKMNNEIRERVQRIIRDASTAGSKLTQAAEIINEALQLIGYPEELSSQLSHEGMQLVGQLPPMPKGAISREFGNLPPAKPIRVPNVRFTTHISNKQWIKATEPVRGATELNGPKQKILDAIATFKAAKVPPRIAAVASFCATTARARGFEENMRQLRAAGMVTSQNGVLDCNGYGHPGEIGSGWNALAAVLSGPQLAMLQVVRENPGVSVEHLASFCDTTVRARGFEENMRRLRADELILGGKDKLQVAEWLQ